MKKDKPVVIPFDSYGELSDLTMRAKLEALVQEIQEIPGVVKVDVWLEN